MATIKIIYWSGTYNTKTMAELIRDGIEKAGKKADLLKVSETSKEEALLADILVLGSPAMGTEVIQQSEMEPFIGEIEADISGKIVVLFGSYGWGDGEWMRNWEERIKSQGAKMPLESLIVEYAPKADDEEACIDLGRRIADL